MKRKLSPRLISTLAWVVLASIAATLAAAEPIKLDSGLISGAAAPGDAKVMVYKGIPFAAPPVGDLRWKPPQPVKPWDGIRECTAFGKACPQNSERLRAIYGIDIGPTSEDCLFINVWTAGKAGDKRPVMLWIHGGSNMTGSGSTGIYDGTLFAKKGMVLVTTNYRLNAFGFMAHPALTNESPHKSSGNYGLLDQIAALEWVQKNAAAFGGDPGNVTIFGESAGGVDVTALMAAPAAAGLFHKVIAESGVATFVTAPLKGGRGAGIPAETAGAQLAKVLGCDSAADQIAAMRGKSAEEIVKACTDNPAIALAPNVDGWVLPMAPAAALAAGRAQNVPLLMGTNANDGSIFVRNPVPDLEGYKKDVQTRFGANADKVFALYPVNSSADVRKALEQNQTDQIFVNSTRNYARASSKQNPKTFLYYFTRVLPGDEARGAYHAAELGFVFGTLPRDAEGKLDPVDEKLTEAMNNYWINFAKTGDPNGNGMTAWPAYTSEKDQHLEFGDKIEAKSGLRKEACDFYESLLAPRTNATAR